jgi:hypothetical protein
MTIIQKPNAPLITAISGFVIHMLVHPVHWLAWLGILAYGLGVAALGYWAYLEITSGVNPFRRMLGWLGMLLAINMAIHYVFY